MRNRRPVALIALLAAIFALAGVAWGGHEVPVYPSYYPHVITIETVAPERAAALLQSSTIQAYLGREPLYSGEPPKPIRAVRSLGDFIVVRIEPEPAAVAGGGCAAMDAAVAAMAGKTGFTFHPYPVTPFHGDYLYHADQAEAAKARFLAAPRTIPPGWRVVIDKLDAAALLAGEATTVNGWLGPAWLKEGWFQAWRILSDGVAGDARNQLAALVERLESSDGDAVERINWQRQLVAALADNCRERIAGYTLRRQYFSAEFTSGIENIGFDSIAGFNSPMFLRTVKLKDFPWNGWLSLGIDSTPQAAWNPVAGFDDPFGQLLWSGIGDPAVLPAPYDAGWILNRAAGVRTSP